MRGSTLVFALVAASSGCIPQTTQFNAPARIPAGRSPTNATSGDINGDGKVDLVYARAWNRGEISVLLGHGDGTFAPDSLHLVTGSTPQSPKLADVNGDGKLDLVVLDFAALGYVSVLLGRGDGTFAEPVNHLLGPSAASVRVADVNGDNKLDLVAVAMRPDTTPATAEIGGKVVVALGHGDGTFDPARMLNVAGTPRGVSVGDWNRDGKPDLMVASLRDFRSEVLFYRGWGDGNFQDAIVIPSRLEAEGVSPPADLDKDGKADLLVSVPGGLEVFLADANGEFHQVADYNVEPTRSAWTADFDHDGNLDIVTARRLLRGDGTGHFVAETLLNDMNSDSAIEGADLNGDGWIDVIATDLNRNTINVYLNRGGAHGATASR